MRHTKKKKQLWITTFGLLVFLHLCVFIAYRISKNADSWSDFIPEAKSEPTPMKTPVGPRSSSLSESSPARVIYPHSIIRGGVRTVEEFKAALLKDNVVAAHFSSFSAPSSRIVELKAEKAAYVAYRVNDKVYWTKKKVRLVKGEKLITDGVNYARARCGNRISEVSQIPMSPEEPSHAFLDRPIPTEDKDRLLLAALPKPAGVSSERTHPAAFSFVPGSRSSPAGFLIPGIIGGGVAAGRILHSGSGGRSGIPIPPIVVGESGLPPVADVPEPGTLLFLSFGMACSMAFRKRLKLSK